MYTKTIGLLSILIMIVGCAGGTTSPGAAIGHASMVAPELGISIDKEMKVIYLYPGSAAEKAGVQIGDILVDLTWIPTTDGETSDASTTTNQQSDTSEVEAGATPVDGEATPIDSRDPLSGVVPIPAPTAPLADYIEKEPVPFTDVEGIMYLTVYGVPLNLRVIRGGEELNIKVTPTVRVRQQISPDVPTPTAEPAGHGTF